MSIAARDGIPKASYDPSMKDILINRLSVSAGIGVGLWDLSRSADLSTRAPVEIAPRETKQKRGQ